VEAESPLDPAPPELLAAALPDDPDAAPLLDAVPPEDADAELLLVPAFADVEPLLSGDELHAAEAETTARETRNDRICMTPPLPTASARTDFSTSMSPCPSQEAHVSPGLASIAANANVGMRKSGSNVVIRSSRPMALARRSECAGPDHAKPSTSRAHT
jgi:hypothetical protein